jgi:hypothetical protein
MQIYCHTKFCRRVSDWLNLTIAISCVQPVIRGVIPRSRLEIEPKVHRDLDCISYVYQVPGTMAGLILGINRPFSYPEPFLHKFDRARRGALAKSINGYHKNMVRKQYPVLELANQMPVRIWIWPEPPVAPRVRRADRVREWD